MSAKGNGHAGQTLRRIRLAQALTLAELSARAGVPLSTLSKLELGQSPLSAEKLTQICAALGVDPGAVLQQNGHNGAPSGRRSVSRLGEGAPYQHGPHDGLLMMSELLAKSFTPVLLDIQARALSDHGPMHTLTGDAYLFVLEGALSLHTDIYAPLDLDAGESIYFDGRIGHALLASGAPPCRALMVVAGDEASALPLAANP